ncbi:TPA: hypothetical protein ACPPFR_000754 [Haemophilus influenzae]
MRFVKPKATMASTRTGVKSLSEWAQLLNSFTKDKADGKTF